MAKLEKPDEATMKKLTSTMDIIQFWKCYVLKHPDKTEKELRDFMRITSDEIMATTGIFSPCAHWWINLWTREDKDQKLKNLEFMILYKQMENGN